MSAIIYHETTGVISAILQSDDKAKEIELSRLNTPEGHVVMTVSIDAREFGSGYVDAGTPTAIPLAPSEAHVFDYVLKKWIDPRTLNDLKALKAEEINAARLNTNRGSFNYAEKAISCDALSRSDLDGVNGYVSLTNSLPSGWPGVWKTIDNTYVQIPDVATWIAFYSAMVHQGQTNFLHSQDLKTALQIASTAAEVENIVW